MIPHDPEGAGNSWQKPASLTASSSSSPTRSAAIPKTGICERSSRTTRGQVGVRVHQRPPEYGAFSTAREEGILNTHQWGLLYPPGAVFNYRTFARHSPNEFHELPDEVTTVVNHPSQATDPAVQEEIFLWASKIIAAEVPQLLLHVPNDNYGISTRVQGFEPRRDQVLWLFNVSLAE